MGQEGKKQAKTKALVSETRLNINRLEKLTPRGEISNDYILLTETKHLQVFTKDFTIMNW